MYRIPFEVLKNFPIQFIWSPLCFMHNAYTVAPISRSLIVNCLKGCQTTVNDIWVNAKDHQSLLGNKRKSNSRVKIIQQNQMRINYEKKRHF